ncbi:MAG TPA: MoaD/ThiS family protein [Fimbriimonas sp.]|nr:MoaD/ThiS family protein [Fimbriimonas sp.]
MKHVNVRFFAAFREAAGVSEADIATSAETLADLYGELRLKYGFALKEGQVKASRNLQFASLEETIQSGDRIVFLPPVAGG